MRYIRLGNTGMKVSRLCLGMMSYGSPQSRAWILPEEDAFPLVASAAQAGITYFDTADMYSEGASEEVTGRILRKLFTRREEYVLATKVFFPMGSGPNDAGLSRKHILSSVEGSLQRLGTDYIDLYQIHRWDYETPIEETMEALHDVVRSGKVRYIGASSMFAWQFAKAQYTAELHGWTRFVSMQNHYNLVYREEETEMIPFCLDQGVGVVPWSPLARGLLAGARKKDGSATTTRSANDPVADALYDEGDYAVVDAVQAVAEQRGVPMAQVALAWLLAKPGVTAPIFGATKPHHIDDAIAAEELELTEEEMAALEAPYRPHPVRSHS
ncbi:MAG: aldo/keto reductase [Catenulispora sp.]|nr:aldo/keto reductase [Catenulispora sp.]